MTDSEQVELSRYLGAQWPRWAKAQLAAFVDRFKGYSHRDVLASVNAHRDNDPRGYSPTIGGVLERLKSKGAGEEGETAREGKTRTHAEIIRGHWHREREDMGDVETLVRWHRQDWHRCKKANGLPLTTPASQIRVQHLAGELVAHGASAVQADQYAQWMDATPEQFRMWLSELRLSTGQLVDPFAA